MTRLVVTGLGVRSAIGDDIKSFGAALMAGEHRFGVLKRKGRQSGSTFLGAELARDPGPERLDKRLARGASLSALAAVDVAYQASEAAELDAVDPGRIGLVVGGTNLQQRELMLLRARHDDDPRFVSPAYGVSFMDSDISGLVTAALGLRGPAFTIGAASASGQVAVIEAARLVRSGAVDACLAIGGLMDLSFWELSAFTNMAAMGSERFAEEPEKAMRPFDRLHDGFVFGEASAAVLIEREGARHVRPLAVIEGASHLMDANRNPNPSAKGEAAAIAAALDDAGWRPEDVDYVNPHGTGSPMGDETELSALSASGLRGALINTTKSITGHALTAAGALEIVATIIQLENREFHPCRNLENPIDDGFEWTGAGPVMREARRALCMSMGFGGINTALCLGKAA